MYILKILQGLRIQDFRWKEAGQALLFPFCICLTVRLAPINYLGLLGKPNVSLRPPC